MIELCVELVRSLFMALITYVHLLPVFLTLCAVFDFRHVHISHLYHYNCMLFFMSIQLHLCTCVCVLLRFLIFSPPALVCGTCLPPSVSCVFLLFKLMLSLRFKLG